MFVRVQTCTGLKAFLCSEFKTAVVAVGQNKLYIFVSVLQFYFLFHLGFFIINWSLLQVLFTLFRTIFILYKRSRLVCECSLHVYLQYYNKCVRQY